MDVWLATHFLQYSGGGKRAVIKGKLTKAPDSGKVQKLDVPKQGVYLKTKTKRKKQEKKNVSVAKLYRNHQPQGFSKSVSMCFIVWENIVYTHTYIHIYVQYISIDIDLDIGIDDTDIDCF